MDASKNSTNAYLATLFTQVKVLAWKNFILKFRHFSVLLLEILVPTAIVLGVWSIKLAVNPKAVGPDMPSAYDSVNSFKNQFRPDSYQSVCTSRNLVWSCMHDPVDCNIGSYPSIVDNPTFYQDHGCMSMQIAIAPSDPTNAGAVQAVADFMTWQAQMYPSTDTSPGPSNYSTFVAFDSEQDFLDYLQQPLYSLVDSLHVFSSAIIFQEGSPNWIYSIRLNMTLDSSTGSNDMVKSTAPKLDISMKRGSQIPANYNLPYMNMFINSQYFSLAEIANSFVATMTCRDATPTSGQVSSNCAADENVEVRMIGGAAFPNGRVLIDGFWAAMGSTFALLMIISILYPLANITKALVNEKESKMREGMLMMALNGEALWISWILHFLCLLLPLSIILTLASSSLFEYSGFVFIFMYFFLFFLSAMAFCVLVSIFFDKARTAAIVGNLGFFAGYFIYVGLNGASSSRSAVMLACLHPATAFTYGTFAFQEYEDAAVGVTSNTWDHSDLYPITFKDTLVMMIVDTLYLFALAWYFGAIWPSEFGTQRPWYFIFQPSYYASLLPAGWLDQGSYGCCCCLQSTEFHRIGNTPEVELVGKAAADSPNPRTDSPNSIGDGGVEPVAEALAQQRTTGMCVDIHNLTKTFDTPTGKKTAVDNLSVTMYSGQITSLLGHNGAGKSTLVAMLTGLISPDSGTAMIQGRSIEKDMSELRRTLGVCPQHDILFPDLTVYEHLAMFASFKGTPAEELEEEVDKMIKSVGLTEKRNAYSKTLSGGQKRKLSVGIAFVGNSKVVILDEPTSGMDPYSRRFTWNVIRQHREGRVVILITHFMDEADLLGDRIAIMGDGKLRCCGSSLFLKRYYGVGYNMTIEKRDINTFKSSVLEKLVYSHIKDAKLLTDVGAELTFQLPFSSSHLFQKLFEAVDDDQDGLGVESYGVSVTTLEEVFIKIAKGTDTSMMAEEGRRKGRAGTADVEAVALHLKDSSKSNNVEGSLDVSKGVGVGSLATAVDADAVVSSHNNHLPLSSVDPDALENGEKEAADTANKMRVISFQKIREEQQLYMFMRHIFAMVTKRYLYFSRDAKTWIYQFIVPCAFVLAGILILVLLNFEPPQPSLHLTATMYNGGIYDDHLPLPYANAEKMCFPCDIATSPNACTEIFCNDIPAHTQDHLMSSLSIDGFNSYPPVSMPYAESIEDVSRALYFNVTKESYKASVFGAMSVYRNDSQYDADRDGAPFKGKILEYVIHGNYSATFAGPLFNALVSESVTRSFNSDVTVETRFHPMPLTSNQGSWITSIELHTAIVFMILGLAMLPASFGMNVVREREVKAKSQQMLSGVSISAYWISTFIWDTCAYQITVLLLTIIAGSVFISEKYMSWYEILVMFGIFELFGMAAMGFTYILSFAFPDAATAQIAMLFFNFIFGFALTIVVMVLRILPSTHDVYMNYLRYFLFLSPLCCAGDALSNLTVRSIWSVTELGAGRNYTVLDWDITGLNMTMLAIEVVVYISITIMIEYVGGLPIYQQMLNKFVVKLPEEPPSVPKGDNSTTAPTPTHAGAAAAAPGTIAVASASSGAWSDLKDMDVKQEEERVRAQTAAGNSTDTIVVNGIQKVYYTGNKHAVKGVTLGIPNGECFGLLGINGAGKTSLLSILSGEIAPTVGDVTLNGLSMSTQSHACRKHIGFCPQFDALFELLTAREHLALYARLKGIAEADIEKVVDDKINEMGLSEYQNRLAGTYSGGNKRKLSVAIAMIGEPSIVFLDEPSTGMDPAARRFMWDIISDIVTKREKCCLILTTHSMEEAEALCTRVGIMVGGVIRCVGSTQHLRTQYGKGYQIEFDMEIPSADAVEAKGQSLMTLIQEQGGSFGAFSQTIAKQKLDDVAISAEHLNLLFNLTQHPEWSERICETGTGSDLWSSQKQNNGFVTLKHLSSWWLLEVQYDQLCSFLVANYDSYVLRERHTSRVRVEISSEHPTTKKHIKLSAIFGAIEDQKKILELDGYSVSQTSLEQIFNQFAAQQEEETGAVAGMA